MTSSFWTNKQTKKCVQEIYQNWLDENSNILHFPYAPSKLQCISFPGHPIPLSAQCQKEKQFTYFHCFFLIEIPKQTVFFFFYAWLLTVWSPEAVKMWVSSWKKYQNISIKKKRHRSTGWKILHGNDLWSLHIPLVKPKTDIHRYWRHNFSLFLLIMSNKLGSTIF